MSEAHPVVHLVGRCALAVVLIGEAMSGVEDRGDPPAVLIEVDFESATIPRLGLANPHRHD